LLEESTSSHCAITRRDREKKSTPNPQILKQKNSKLSEQVYKKSPRMLVKVKLLTGNQTEIDIDPTDTIARIKERVEEKAGIDPKQQRLIFGGRQLADEKTANDYNIEGGSVLHLVIALRGGRL